MQNETPLTLKEGSMSALSGMRPDISGSGPGVSGMMPDCEVRTTSGVTEAASPHCNETERSAPGHGHWQPHLLRPLPVLATVSPAAAAVSAGGAAALAAAVAAGGAGHPLPLHHHHLPLTGAATLGLRPLILLRYGLLT